MATSSEIPQSLVSASEIPHEGGEQQSVDLPESIQRHQSPSYVLSPLSTSSLPNEILLKIFSFLDTPSLLQCSKVSKLWEVLASDPHLWKNIDISVKLSSETLNTVATYCGASLRRLRVDRNIIEEDALQKLISGSSNLESICIENNYLSHRTLRVIALKCKKLKRLNIDNVSTLRGDALQVLCQNCNFLEDLRLKGALFLDRDIEAIARGCPGLKCFGGDSKLYFSPESLGVLARGCRELRRVFLENCHALTDEHVIELVSNSSGLTHLSLAFCSSVNNASLHALSKHCPGLEDLNFYKCCRLSHDGFAALARNCPRLRKLNLGSNGLVTDKTVSVFLDHCPSITMLDLSFCMEVTDASLIRLGTCPKITHLRLCGNKRITDVGISHLSGMERLRVLSVTSCPHLSDACVYQFNHLCPNLEVLEHGRYLRYESAVIDDLENDKPIPKYDLE